MSSGMSAPDDMLELDLSAIRVRVGRPPVDSAA